MDYNVKDKVDGKYFTFGKVTEGERGPRLGMRVCPELRRLIASKKDGEWLNFLMFPNDRKKEEVPQSGGYSPLGDDSIPFAPV